MSGIAMNRSVPSPCVSICRVDEASRCCAGCGRTLDEIARWGGMADDEKRSVWALLPDRLSRLAAAGVTVGEPARRTP